MTNERIAPTMTNLIAFASMHYIPDATADDLDTIAPEMRDTLDDLAEHFDFDIDDYSAITRINSLLDSTEFFDAMTAAFALRP